MYSFAGKRVLVTGATGFLGRHLVQALRTREVKQLTAVGQKDFDLTQEAEAARMFKELSPQVVFNLAGLVGGNLANKTRPAEFFYQNLMLGTLTLHQAHKHKVEKYIGVGSGCMYPEFAPMPLKESTVWDGLPRLDSCSYSQAKRMVMVQTEALHRQFGFNCVVGIPGNAYGEFDNFNLDGGHVIPNLIRKFVEAKEARLGAVEVWGGGEATRDYVYAGDAIAGLLRAAEVYSKAQVVNLSSGRETSVKELCAVIQEVTGYEGKIQWLTDKPEGQKRRWFDVSKAKTELGFTAGTTLKAGIELTTKWYLANRNSPDLRR